MLRLHLSSLIGYELIKNIKRVEDKFYLRLGSFLCFYCATVGARPENARAFLGPLLVAYPTANEKIKKVLAIVSNLLYSIRCTIVVQWHFYAIF